MSVSLRPLLQRPALLLALALLTLIASRPAAAQSSYYAAAQAAAQQRAAHAAAWHRYHQQMAAYRAQQQAPVRPVAQPRPAPTRPLPLLRYDGRYAAAHTGATPRQVQYAVGAGNALQGKPYRLGGGHSRVDDNAYDCSGTVSYVLIKSGLLRAPTNSAGFASYGNPGPGRFITIWVKPGEHVFMTICGLRLDTTGGSRGEGPRWRTKPRSTAGFIPRHPPGF